MKAVTLGLMTVCLAVSVVAFANGAALSPRFSSLVETLDYPLPAPQISTMNESWSLALQYPVTQSRALGLDVQVVLELNAQAQEIWKAWISCQKGAGIAGLRKRYFENLSYCAQDSAQSQNLRKSVNELKDKLRDYLATTKIIDQDLDPSYQLPRQLGLIHPLLIQFLTEEIAAQPLFISDMNGPVGGEAKVARQFSTSVQRGRQKIFIGNWPFRNALLLLSLMPNRDRESCGLFPDLTGRVVYELIVSPLLDMFHGASGSYPGGVGDVRELIDFGMKTSILDRCLRGDSSNPVTDPFFELGFETIAKFRSLRGRP